MRSFDDWFSLSGIVSCMSSITPVEIEALKSKGAFMISVIPTELYLASRADPSLSMECHGTVLRPLLEAATQAWAYELDAGSKALKSAGHILTRKAGKYAIALQGDPITGHEVFWNSGGGERGSIVLLFEPSGFPAATILPHCERVFIVNNPSVAHSPAAFRFVKTMVASEGSIAVMLTRSNGIQWLSVHAAPSLIVPLYAKAKSMIRNSETRAP